MPLPLELVEEIIRERAIAEEQPVAPPGTLLHAFFHESTKRGDSRARADHNDVGIAVGREPEARIRFDEDRQRIAFIDAIGDVRRRGSPMVLTECMVLHHRNRKVHLPGVGARAGGDRVGSRAQLAQQGDEVLRIDIDRESPDDVDDLVRVKELDQGLLVPVLQQFPQLARPADIAPGAQESVVACRDLEAVRQGFAQGDGLVSCQDFVLFARTQNIEELCDQLPRVTGNDAQRVSRLIAQPGSVE